MSKRRKEKALHGQGRICLGENKKKEEENPFLQVNADLSPANRPLLHSSGTRRLQVNLDS